MTPAAAAHRGTVLFREFELDLGRCELSRCGRAVKLERIPMELLMLLVERREELVTREEIAAKLWGETVFLDSDSSINTAILKLRRVLKDNPQRPVFIKTVSGRGYRFIGPVTRKEDTSGRAGTVPSPRVMIAVLPFQDLSPQPEQEYFSDGLTEETISNLGRCNPEALGVIARTSSMAYKRTEKGIGQIGRELGVDLVLESSVRREGQRVRISSQLIRVSDQTHLWAATFDREGTSFLGIQDELGRAIAGQVQVKLTNPTAASAQSSPRNREAYDFYLRGRYYWNQLTPPAIRQAISYFEQAVAVDPDYALAWSGMADCYSMLPITCDAPALEILPKALAAAWRAVELDERSAEAHTSVGTVKVWMDWDWRGAEIALRRALELNPSYVQAHRYYACLLSHTGRHDEAAAEMDRARALDPLSPIMHALSGHLRYHAGDYQGARAHLSDALAIKPDLWIVHTFLGRVYECQGHLDMAMAAFEKAFTLSGGGATEPIAFRARMEALSGNRAAAEAALRMLQDVATRKYVPPYNIAMIYAGLGDWDSALDWLEKGLEERDVRLVFLKVEPRWNPLRDQRRFRNLLQRLQLENTGAVESGGY